MLKNLDWFEALVKIVCLVFIFSMCLFHISYDWYLGIKQATWETIWAISINGFTLVILILISNLTIGHLSYFFRWILVPYFVLKLVYDFSVFSSIYLISPERWENIWSWFLPALIVLSSIRWLYKTQKRC
jgi:hypothetical protein